MLQVDITQLGCFNPRLREGGDNKVYRIVSYRRRFNPRLREGGDDLPAAFSYFRKVSIHASAREATCKRHNATRIINRFNPRLREGGDISRVFLQLVFNCFNPRLREGGDLQHSRCVFYWQCFNPRLREGGDQVTLQGATRSAVSIHASAREATSDPFSTAGFRNGFNPRLREGGDKSGLAHGTTSMFQSTPPRGRRPGMAGLDR